MFGRLKIEQLFFFVVVAQIDLNSNSDKTRTKEKKYVTFFFRPNQ